MPEFKNLKISGLQSSVTALPKPDRNGNLRFYDDNGQLLTEFNLNSTIITKYTKSLDKIASSDKFKTMTAEEKSEAVVATIYSVFGGFDKRSLDFISALNDPNNFERKQEITQSYFDYYNSRPKSVEKIYELYGKDSLTCLNTAPLAQFGGNKLGIDSYLVLCAQKYNNSYSAGAHLTLITEHNSALETTTLDIPNFSSRKIKTSGLDETVARLQKGEPIVTIVEEINNISALSTTKEKETLTSDEVTRLLKEAIENEIREGKDTYKEDKPHKMNKKPKDLSSANFEKVINLSITIANSGVVMSDCDYQISSGKQVKSQQMII